MNELTKKRLIGWADSCENKDFAAHDPVRIPRRFFLHQDIEIAAFVTSWLCYGRRDESTNAAETVMGYMGTSPYRYIMKREYKDFEDCDALKLHGFLSWHDYFCVCEVLHSLYTTYESMEEYMLDSVKGHAQDEADDLYLTPLINLFEGCYGVPMTTVSACYGLCLFLRWMVRTGSEVDLGLWKCLSPARLVMPLNSRTFRTAMELGLLSRKSRDMKAAVMLTREMRKAFGTDPLRGCFALESYEMEKQKQREAV